MKIFFSPEWGIFLSFNFLLLWSSESMVYCKPANFLVFALLRGTAAFMNQAATKATCSPLPRGKWGGNLLSFPTGVQKPETERQPRQKTSETVDGKPEMDPMIILVYPGNHLVNPVLKRNGIFGLRQKRNPRFIKIPNLWRKRKPLPIVLS